MTVLPIFIHTRNTPVEILSEQIVFNFLVDFHTTVPYVRSGSDSDKPSQFFNSFENSYTEIPLLQLNANRLAFLPLAVDAGNGFKAVITETNLMDYPADYTSTIPME